MWERVIEKQGRQQQGEAETPPLFAHPPVYNSPFQQDHSRWGGSVDVLFLRVNSIEPLVGVCCAEDPVNCVPPCVSSIYPSSVSFSTPPPHRAASLKCLLLLTDGPQRRLWMLLLLLSDFAAFHQRHTQRNLVWTGGFRVGADLDLCENTKITNIHKSKATTETQQDQSLPNETHLTCVKRHAGSWDKL